MLQVWSVGIAIITAITDGIGAAIAADVEYIYGSGDVTEGGSARKVICVFE